MNKLKDSIKISDLIVKSYHETLNSKETQLLNTWIEISDENRKIYKNAANGLNNVDLDIINKLDRKRAWKNIERSIVFRKRTPIYLKYAAILIIPLTIAGILIFNYKDNSLHIGSVVAESIPIKSGTQKARLVLASGNTIDLQGSNSIPSNSLPGVNISNINNNLSLKSLQNNDVPITPNTIVVPRGGEYSITLEDGTKVWLNSESTLTFPNIFRDKTRKVYLEGEAYFEVAPKKGSPFVVEMKTGAEVMVLGTKFNINAYGNENSILTTLVEGSVKVSAFYNNGSDNNVSHTLIPGQQSELNSNGEFFIKIVNTDQFIAWTQGRFVFEKDNLDNILRQLSRWYDVSVSFENDSLKYYHFTGDLPRYDNIDIILEMLKDVCNKVEFNLKRREIIVTSKL